MTDTARPPNKNLPPDRVGYPDPKGPVRWAEVYRRGQRVGAVWMTDLPRSRPRAGIILDAHTPPDPVFQQDLGPVTLDVMGDSLVDAASWLDHLSETRTGIGMTLSVGEARMAESLDDVRDAIGWS